MNFDALQRLRALTQPREALTLLRKKANAAGRRAAEALRPPEWLRKKRAVDQAFDSERGIDTGGVVHLHKLAVPSANRRHASSYIASDPEEFRRALADLPIDHARFTFVDIGCGKGRALILAADLPFRRFIGVEFARELWEAAQTNVARALDGARAMELLWMDALEFELPDEPLVIYLYHPFSRELVARFAERTLASYARTPRELYIVYTNPEYASAFEDAGFVPLARGDVHAIYAPRAAVPAQRAAETEYSNRAN